jgi:transposase-like protein
MRRNGTRKLPDSEKAAIIAKKRLGLSTVKEIARQHHIAENTVYAIVRNPSENVLKMVHEISKALTVELDRARDLALQRILDKLESDPCIPLNQLATTFGILSDKHQLETGKPTAISMAQITPEEHAVEWFKILLTHAPYQEAIQLLRRSPLAPLVADSTRDLVARKLETGELKVEV